LLHEWPACRTALLDDLPREKPWVLSLPGISCLAVGGDSDDAIPVAAAWTALRKAAHLLDAVQDRDDVTITGFDTPAKIINLATGMIFAAYHFLDCVQTHPGSARQVIAVFSEAAFCSSLGQHQGLDQAHGDLPLGEALAAYWRSVISKSGSLFRMATAGGAVAGAGSAHLVTSLGDYGNCLGVILQVIDDCRDVLRHPDTADYEVSLPLLLLLLTTHKGPSRHQVTRLLSPGACRERQALFEVLHRANVPAIITDVLLEWRRRALDSLKSLEHPSVVQMLEGILDHVLTDLPSTG